MDIKYVLNPSLAVKKIKNGNLIIIVPDCMPLQYSSNHDLILDFLLLHSEGTPLTLDNYYAALYEQYALQKEEVDDIIEEFLKDNVLKKVHSTNNPYFSDIELDKYSRQLLTFTTLRDADEETALNFQKSLKDAVVTIIGVGGVGSHIAYGLTAIGVGHINLIDNDIVEMSNTSRQLLYDETDIGKTKISAAIERLQKVNQFTKFNGLELFIDAHTSSNEKLNQFISGSGLVLLCADHPRGKIQTIIDMACSRNETPWTLCAPFHFSKIMLGPIFGTEIVPSYCDVFADDGLFEEDIRVEHINSLIRSNIMEPFNGLCANMMLVEIVKFLTKCSPPTILANRIVVDTKTWSIDVIDTIGDSNED